MIDAVETRCVAMGDRFCEIEIGTPDIIAKKRQELWKKWGIK